MAINLPDLPNGLKLANTGITPGDHQGDTLIVAFNKFNSNAQITLTVNDPLAGLGLVWNKETRRLSLSIPANNLLIGSTTIPYSTDHFYIENGIFKTRLDNRPIISGRLLLTKDYIYIGGADGRAEEIPINFNHFELKEGNLQVKHKNPVYYTNVEPLNPLLGDLWWDTTEEALKLYATDEILGYSWKYIYISDDIMMGTQITANRLYLTDNHIIVGNTNSQGQDILLSDRYFKINNSTLELRHRSPVVVNGIPPANNIATPGDLWFDPEENTLCIYIVDPQSNIGNWRSLNPNITNNYGDNGNLPSLPLLKVTSNSPDGYIQVEGNRPRFKLSTTVNGFNLQSWIHDPISDNFSISNIPNRYIVSNASEQLTNPDLNNNSGRTWEFINKGGVLVLAKSTDNGDVADDEVLRVNRIDGLEVIKHDKGDIELYNWRVGVNAPESQTPAIDQSVKIKLINYYALGNGYTGSVGLTLNRNGVFLFRKSTTTNEYNLDTTVFTIENDNVFKITQNIASTSATTGSLVVNGGVGINGNLNIQGNNPSIGLFDLNTTSDFKPIELSYNDGHFVIKSYYDAYPSYGSSSVYKSNTRFGKEGVLLSIGQVAPINPYYYRPENEAYPTLFFRLENNYTDRNITGNQWRFAYTRDGSLFVQNIGRVVKNDTTGIESIVGDTFLVINGVSHEIKSNKIVRIANQTNTTSATTGALVVDGGMGVGGDIFIENWQPRLYFKNTSQGYNSTLNLDYSHTEVGNINGYFTVKSNKIDNISKYNLRAGHNELTLSTGKEYFGVVTDYEYYIENESTPKVLYFKLFNNYVNRLEAGNEWQFQIDKNGFLSLNNVGLIRTELNTTTNKREIKSSISSKVLNIIPAKYDYILDTTHNTETYGLRLPIIELTGAVQIKGDNKSIVFYDTDLNLPNNLKYTHIICTSDAIVNDYRDYLQRISIYQNPQIETDCPRDVIDYNPYNTNIDYRDYMCETTLSDNAIIKRVGTIHKGTLEEYVYKEPVVSDNYLSSLLILKNHRVNRLKHGADWRLWFRQDGTLTLENWGRIKRLVNSTTGDITYVDETRRAMTFVPQYGPIPLDEGEDVTEYYNPIVIIPSLSGSGTTTVSVTSDGTLIRSQSDRRLKTNVQLLEYGLTELARLSPVRFEWVDKEKYGANKEIGLIAQEVKEVIPEVITEDEKGYLSLDYPKLTSLLIRSVQELLARVETLESLISNPA